MIERACSNPFPLIDLTTMLNVMLVRHERSVPPEMLLKNMMQQNAENRLTNYQRPLAELMRKHYTKFNQPEPSPGYLLNTAESASKEQITVHLYYRHLPAYPLPLFIAR